MHLYAKSDGAYTLEQTPQNASVRPDMWCKSIFFFFFGFYMIRSEQVVVSKVARSLATLEPA